MDFHAYDRYEQQISALKYDRDRMFERMKELAQMYRGSGLFDQYYSIMFIVTILEAEFKK